jgi:hypothetical protein
MIDVIHKIHTDYCDPHSLFAEVTVDSIANHALHIGYNFTDSRTVVFANEVDRLIEILTILKETYLQ